MCRLFEEQLNSALNDISNRALSTMSINSVGVKGSRTKLNVPQAAAPSLQAQNHSGLNQRQLSLPSLMAANQQQQQQVKSRTVGDGMRPALLSATMRASRKLVVSCVEEESEVRTIFCLHLLTTRHAVSLFLMSIANYFENLALSILLLCYSHDVICTSTAAEM